MWTNASVHVPEGARIKVSREPLGGMEDGSWAISMRFSRTDEDLSETQVTLWFVNEAECDRFLQAMMGDDR